MKTFLVGGAVRDELIGLAVKDRDWVVVGSTPEKMLKKGFQSVGKDFPVFLHPETGEEYALARTERKSGSGYTGFTCDASPSITLEEDLMRRDLTINAIAKNEAGDLIDPYSGQEDIKQKLLRHVSPAFSEDPLRVLRVARFAARFANLGFTIAEETQALMTDLTESGELEHLTAERVWKETEKALMTQRPEVYFEVLRECGALKVLFPEIDALYGVPQTEKHHPEVDTGIHNMMVVQISAQLSDALATRYAALTHDLGKGITPKEEWPKHIQHETKGIKLVKKMSKRLRVPKEVQKLAELVCEFHLHSHRAFELRAETIAKLFKKLDLYRRPERLQGFLDACEADARGRLGFENKPYPQAEYLKICFHAARGISKKDIDTTNLNGPEIGLAIDKERINQISRIKSAYKEQHND